MKKFVEATFVASLFCGTVAFAGPASDDVGFDECGYLEEAPIFGVGMASNATAAPVLMPLEQGIVDRGDKSESLRSIAVPATMVDGWTSDYAMMRLSQVAGKPIWAMTESGLPGEDVTIDIPATNLADAFDRIAEAKGKRWRYDGEKVYLLGGREWTMPLPASRDLSIAVRDALLRNDVNVRFEDGGIRFKADNAGAATVTSVVHQVYGEERLNPYDVKFYKVYPTKGTIDWATLVERTNAIETVSFEGKGATIVLDPTAGAVIDAFLAREGQVHSLGSTTMVSSQAGAGSSHAAGCGASTSGTRGLHLTGGAYERGRVSMTYSILGAPQEQSGTLAVTPGAVVVLADAVPDQGGYMVAVVRPRVLELKSPVRSGPLVVPTQVAAAD